jgi:hypothetical protein
MKGINTSGQELNSGGVASFSVPRDGVSHLAFPALAPERNHHDDSFPLAPLGNDHAKHRESWHCPLIRENYWVIPIRTGSYSEFLGLYP